MAKRSRDFQDIEILNRQADDLNKDTILNKMLVVGCPLAVLFESLPAATAAAASSSSG
jgi:hypothetical protein